MTETPNWKQVRAAQHAAVKSAQQKLAALDGATPNWKQVRAAQHAQVRAAQQKLAALDEA